MTESEAIELLIKIDEEVYKAAIESGYSHMYDEEVANAIAKGIPVPKKQESEAKK